MNNANDYTNHLPSKLRLALWKRIDRHLQLGEALVSTELFFRVMEQEFARLIGVRPSAKIRQALCEMIAHVNEQYSDKYMAYGIHNAVKDYLARMPHRPGRRRGDDGADAAAAQADGARWTRRSLP